MAGMTCAALAPHLVEARASGLGLPAGGLVHAGVHLRRAGDVGADAAWVHAGGAHAALGHVQFLAQGLGEAAHREFAAVVSALRGRGQQAEQAGGVDHMAFTGALEVRQEGLRAPDHAPEVDAHDPFEIFGLDGFDEGPQGHTGVVEDQVDLAVVAGGLVGPGEHGFAVGHIELGRGDFHALRQARFGGQQRGLGQALFVDVAQGEVAAAACQFEGQGAAHARSRARDGGHFALEVFHRDLMR